MSMTATSVTGDSLEVDHLVEVVVADPSDPMSNGRLRAYRDLYTSPGTVAYTVFDAVIATPLRDDSSLPASYRNPTTAGFVPVEERRSRDLRPAEVAWVQSLPEDPAKMSDDDARLLAGLSETVASDIDRSLIGRRLDPVAVHHDVRARIVELERRIWTAPKLGADPTRRPVFNDVLNLAAQKIRAEMPELTEFEARNRARDAVQTAAGRIRDARRSDPLADRSALAELCRSTGQRSTVYPDAHTWRAAPPPYQPPSV